MAGQKESGADILRRGTLSTVARWTGQDCFRVCFLHCSENTRDLASPRAPPVLQPLDHC